MFRLKGVVPPMITTFKKNGEIDFTELNNLVEYLSHHVQGLFICGSYGSGPLMSVEERKKVAENTVKIVNGKILIIVHVGTTNTRDTIKLAIHAKKIGCDAVAAVGPYYYSHTENDLLKFYSDIIQAVGENFPVYAYHNPKFQGYEFSLSLIKKLKDIGLNGIKDSTFNIITFANYMREFEMDNFDVVLGTEAMWLSARALGCEAFIPGLGNAFPELCVKMWREGMQNDFDACRKTQFLINKIRSIMYLADSTQQAVYSMASLRGITNSYPRAPFTPLANKKLDKLQLNLKELGVL